MKKALSILLALTMALALALPAAASAGPVQTPGSATKNFSDMGDVKNIEAADVLVSAGVVSGSTATTIDPRGTYTREQAAKIICYMRLGPAEAERLTCTSDPFGDVKANRWSAPYISYLVKNGDISGMGDGNFDPTDAVSGYELGKMALCALGYGVNQEYAGSGWAINVAADAKAIGLSAGCGDKVISSASLTRDTGMQIAFNALANTQLVKYDEAANVYTGTGTTMGADALGLTLNLTGNDHGWTLIGSQTDLYPNNSTGGAMPTSADSAVVYGGAAQLYAGGKTVTAAVADGAALTITNSDGLKVQSSALAGGAALPLKSGGLDLTYSAAGELTGINAAVESFPQHNLGLGVVTGTTTVNGASYANIYTPAGSWDYLINSGLQTGSKIVSLNQNSNGGLSLSNPANTVSGVPSNITISGGVVTGMTISGTTLTFSGSTTICETGSGTDVKALDAASMNTSSVYSVAYHTADGVNVADMVCRTGAAPVIIIIPPVETPTPLPDVGGVQ